jgi:hypothetical protein
MLAGTAVLTRYVLFCPPVPRSKGTLLYTAGTWEIEVEAESCPDHKPPTVTIFNTTYYLVQFHFHGVRYGRPRLEKRVLRRAFEVLLGLAACLGWGLRGLADADGSGWLCPPWFYSEHTKNGMYFPMELHMVHSTFSNGTLNAPLVVGAWMVRSTRHEPPHVQTRGARSVT